MELTGLRTSAMLLLAIEFSLGRSLSRVVDGGNLDALSSLSAIGERIPEVGGDCAKKGCREGSVANAAASGLARLVGPMELYLTSPLTCVLHKLILAHDEIRVLDCIWLLVFESLLYILLAISHRLAQLSDHRIV